MVRAPVLCIVTLVPRHTLPSASRALSSLLLSSPSLLPANFFFVCIFLNCHGDFCVLGNKKRKEEERSISDLKQAREGLCVDQCGARRVYLCQTSVCPRLKTTIMCRVVDAWKGSERCSGELAEGASSWVATGADMTPVLLLLLLCLLASVAAAAARPVCFYIQPKLVKVSQTAAQLPSLAFRGKDWSCCHVVLRLISTLVLLFYWSEVV